MIRTSSLRRYGRPALAMLSTACDAASANAKTPVDATSISSTATNPLTDVAMQTILALVTIMVLIIAVGWIMKKTGSFSRSQDGLINVVSTLSLGSRERVILMQVGQRQLLIGATTARISTLHVFEEGIELAKTDRHASSQFSQLLAMSAGKLTKLSAAQRKNAAPSADDMSRAGD